MTAGWTKKQMAAKAASLIEDNAVVNLGIGMPTLIADHIGDRPVWIHSENGLLGMGPFPHPDDVDPQLINAGKQTVTVVPGGSTFDSALSFAMIRGSHVDQAFLGAMQVSCAGDLANWAVPGGRVMGIGGAMDLAAGAREVTVLSRHQTKTGAAKLVSQCSYPLTATAVVTRVITDLGVFECKAEYFQCTEVAPSISEDDIRVASDAMILF